MAEVQIQIPEGINQFVQALKEMGFEFKFDPHYRTIIIKGTITDMGYTYDHAISISLKQGELKKLIIKRYPKLAEADISNISISSQSKHVELPPQIHIFFFEKYLQIEYEPIPQS
jgi:hypothetical protein